MKIHGVLKPFMHDLFQSRPDITTGDAVGEIRDFLTGQPDGDRHYDEAADMGFASLWGGFTGELRRKAQQQIKAATISITPTGITVSVLENMKLPLADGDFSPTYADSTVLMLRQSITYMVTQSRGLERQIGMAQQLADILDAAALACGEPGLTLREAFSRGLINWAQIAAA